MSIIPLTTGLAYQTFSTTVGNVKLRFYFQWLTRYQYYSVSIFDYNGDPIACGRALHPNINLLSGLNLDIGSIILQGEIPTMSNLGVTNSLIWYAE